MFILVGFSYLFIIVTTADWYTLSAMSDNPTKKYPFSNYSNPFPDASIVQFINCKSMSCTHESNFIVILLYKTSGRYLGLGGIIDRKTVITAQEVVRPALGKPHEILILAGYFSPWWGKCAEVRKTDHMATNNYELALLGVTPDLIYMDSIAPIKIAYFENVVGHPANIPDDVLGVYGVKVGRDHYPGNSVEKGKFYSFALHTVMKEKDCIQDYDDLIPGTSKIQYICLAPNGSFCSGCLGSPVVVTENSSTVRHLVGIVIRSSCEYKTRKVVMVSLRSSFESWITLYKSFY